MTIVSNDPTWWPSIHAYRFSSYFGVAAFVGHSHSDKRSNPSRQRWYLMTVLHLTVRYLGILSAGTALSMVAVYRTGKSRSEICI
ncbi:uncharacterized protein F5147DRAFT_117661 [Suillus discolor]|uniref:Uncharacterized protein n=1 Tax=Suillus discolor TaxID=1912936 RepID=A0A9P7FID0_9AGAM|nr:uncharacterized protein F5147DRAFT_117661 [Suillus discolor]KAG2119595.1 hypothetical protein F5147DRAFT_117661 [Suillus discolor]